MPLPTLYAFPGFNGATMLFERPDCNSASWLAVTDRTLREGEIWTYAYGKSYRVQYARAGEWDRALRSMPSEVIDARLTELATNTADEAEDIETLLAAQKMAAE